MRTCFRTLTTALGILALTGLTAVSLRSQDVSMGGSFLPNISYVLGGTWTFKATSPFVFEGATNDDFETTFAVADPTADRTFTFPDSTSGTFLLSSLASNAIDVVNSIWGASNGLVFEGATADAFEATLSPGDPVADVTITLPVTAAAAVMVTSLTTNQIDSLNGVWGVSNGLVFEGATANAFETTLSPTDVGGDITLTLPGLANASGAILASTLTTNDVNVANSVWAISNALAFGGATGADGFEIQLTPADVGADRVVTIPDMGAASALLASTLTTNTVGAANALWGVSNGLVFEGATGAADAFETTVTVTDPTADNTVTIQNTSGTVTVQTQATVTLTNVDLDTVDNSIAANVCEDQASVTAAGVAATDQLFWVMTTTDLSTNFSVVAMVPGAGVVTIRVCNETAGALDPGAVADFRLTSIK